MFHKFLYFYFRMDTRRSKQLRRNIAFVEHIHIYYSNFVDAWGDNIQKEEEKIKARCKELSDR